MRLSVTLYVHCLPSYNLFNIIIQVLSQTHKHIIYTSFPQHVLIISLSLSGEHTVITKNE